MTPLSTTPKTVTIPTMTYLDLVESDFTLTALEHAGVDNWEGYGEVDWEAVDEKVAAVKAELDAASVAGSQETTGAATGGVE